MKRLLFVLPLLAACPPEGDAPPPVPSRIDQPPPTPDVETCNADPSTLPFSENWTPITYAPLPADPAEQLYAGSIRLPSDLGVPLDDLRVHGTIATVTHLVDDGTTLSATYTATATCSGVCGWNEVEVHTTSGVLRLQGIESELSLESTALLALDLSRAEAAARNGPAGLLPGARPDLDANVPEVVAAMRAHFDDNGSLGVDSGGAPVPGTAVFVAVDNALSDDTVPAPAVPPTATWQLNTLSVPTDARLVVVDGHRVSLPLTAGDGDDLAWHLTEPVDAERPLVFRFLFADGRQSPAGVSTQLPSTSGPPPMVEAGDGDTIAVVGATPTSWLLQRSNASTPIRGACRIGDDGEALMAVDPTTGFTLLEVGDDLAITSLLGCRWSSGETDCSVP